MILVLVILHINSMNIAHGRIDENSLFHCHSESWESSTALISYGSRKHFLENSSHVLFCPFSCQDVSKSLLAELRFFQRKLRKDFSEVDPFTIPSDKTWQINLSAHMLASAEPPV